MIPGELPSDTLVRLALRLSKMRSASHEMKFHRPSGARFFTEYQL